VRLLAGSTLLLVVALLFAVSAHAQDSVAMRVGPPQGAPRAEGAALEREAKQVSALLRCPVCQGLSIDDSPAPMAVNMRGEVRDLLRKGYSKEQVLAYFESSYGEFVRLEPKREGFNWLVWILPAIGLGAGLLALFAYTRRQASGSMPQRSAAPDAPVEEELAPYVDRVRAMVREGSAAR
jgi:cytochrome c-type biogenesis protein CcmH